jgi:hypothetical protein
MCHSHWRQSLLVSLITALLFVGRGKAEDTLPFLAALRVKPSASIATGVLRWQETMWASYAGRLLDRIGEVQGIVSRAHSAVKHRRVGDYTNHG